jgi:hypothetical protein
MIVSISIPIALSFLIFPESRSRRFLGRKTSFSLLGVLFILLVSVTSVEFFFDPDLAEILPLLILPTAIILASVYGARKLPPPDPNKRLHGIFSGPLSLLITSVVFFIITFAPTLGFFPIRFIPDALIPTLFYHYFGTPSILAMVYIFYPVILAALAFRFFIRYSLSDIQLLSIISGIMVVPILSAITLFNLAQGAPVAAIFYVVSIIAAWRQIRNVARQERHSTGPELRTL